MSLFARLFGGKSRNERLAAWARSVPITETQRTAMQELWQASRQERVPDVDPLSRLTQHDREYITKICSADFRPSEFGLANVHRLASWRYFRDLKFSEEQAAVLVGMMFNMVGRDDI